VSSGGIPAPPFSAQPKKTGPKLKSDEPFQSVSAEEAAPKPQDIKVEIGHDVVQQQKKSFLKVLTAAVIAALVGCGIGWAIGSMNTRNSYDQKAVADAKSLIEPISAAKTNIEGLQETVAAATKTLYKEKKYPEDFTKKLAKVEIAFSAADLSGLALHRLKPSLMRMLFDFARDAQELDARKDALRRLFDARKEAITKLIAQGEKPKIGYSVFVQKDRQGKAVGTFVPIEKPFEFDEKEWPDEFKLDTGNKVVDAQRYEKGEPFMQYPRRKGEDPTIYAIPLEPDGVNKAFPPRLTKRIEEEVKAVGALIAGTESGSVRLEDEKTGLLKLADNIVRALRAVGAAR